QRADAPARDWALPPSSHGGDTDSWRGSLPSGGTPVAPRRARSFAGSPRQHAGPGSQGRSQVLVAMSFDARVSSVQRQVSAHLFRLAVLVLELTQPAQLTDLQAAKLGLPAVVRAVAAAHRSAHVRDGLSHLHTPQDGDDLLLADAAFAHVIPLPFFQADFLIALGPRFGGKVIVSLTLLPARMQLEVASERGAGACPRCGTQSERIHTSYTRTVADVPCAGRQVTMTWHVHRFRCSTSACSQPIF